MLPEQPPCVRHFRGVSHTLSYSILTFLRAIDLFASIRKQVHRDYKFNNPSKFVQLVMVSFEVKSVWIKATQLGASPSWLSSTSWGGGGVLCHNGQPSRESRSVPHLSTLRQLCPSQPSPRASRGQRDLFILSQD